MLCSCPTPMPCVRRVLNKSQLYTRVLNIHKPPLNQPLSDHPETNTTTSSAIFSRTKQASLTHSLHSLLSRYWREERGRRYGLYFLQTLFEGLTRRSTSALDARGDHTNTIHCKRRTLVQCVKRINFGIEHGKKCGTTMVESREQLDQTRLTGE